MDFRHPDGRKIAVFLQRRSLLVIAGESRYLWTHGIAARQFDEVHSEMPGFRNCQSTVTASQSRARVSTATILPRETRVSLTFRKVRKKPCICTCSKCLISDDLSVIIIFYCNDAMLGYPFLCDSQQPVEERTIG